MPTGWAVVGEWIPGRVEPHERDHQPLLVHASGRVVAAELVEGDAPVSGGPARALGLDPALLARTALVHEHQSFGRMEVVVVGDKRPALIEKADRRACESRVAMSTARMVAAMVATKRVVMILTSLLRSSAMPRVDAVGKDDAMVGVAGQRDAEDTLRLAARWRRHTRRPRQRAAHSQHNAGAPRRGQNCRNPLTEPVSHKARRCPPSAAARG